MFPLPNQLGLGSTTIPEIPASETAASFNFNVSSKARNLIQQIAISKNKETMMPLLNQLLRDRTINNKLKNHILSSLQERDINVVRQRFKQLAVDLHQPAPPTFDVGDGPSLPVVPASETPSSFNAEVSEPQPIVQDQAKATSLIASEPLQTSVVENQDAPLMQAAVMPPAQSVVENQDAPLMQAAVMPPAQSVDNQALAAGGSVDNSTQAVAAGGPIKKSYIIGGVVLLSAIGGYFIWKNRQS